MCYYTLVQLQIINLYIDFYLENLYWVVGLAVLVFCLFYLIIDKIHDGKAEKEIEKKVNLYLEALGGENNVISHELVGSRIVVSLRDYSKVNQAKLEQAGVAGFIEKSDKLTMVVKHNAEKVYNSIFPN